MDLQFLLILATFIGLYFLPMMFAAARDHKNMVAIAVLNTLAGWTLLGWLIALIWALTATGRDAASP